MFELLVLVETLLCVLLMIGTFKLLAEVPATPEVCLGQRAWVAARFSMEQADALGPLFQHLTRATRHGLRRAHRMQEAIRTQRARRASPPVLEPLVSLWRRRREQRSEELAELSYLVEQLELMGRALARYRAGAGGLLELGMPLQSLRGD